MTTREPLDDYWLNEVMWRLINRYRVGRIDGQWAFNRSRDYQTISAAVVDELLQKGLIVRQCIDGLHVCTEQHSITMSERWPRAATRVQRGMHEVSRAGRAVMARFLREDDVCLMRPAKDRRGDWQMGIPGRSTGFAPIKTALRRKYAELDGNELRLTTRGHRAWTAHRRRRIAEYLQEARAA